MLRTSSQLQFLQPIDKGRYSIAISASRIRPAGKTAINCNQQVGVSPETSFLHEATLTRHEQHVHMFGSYFLVLCPETWRVWKAPLGIMVKDLRFNKLIVEPWVP
jgi:hypothetical protein